MGYFEYLKTLLTCEYFAYSGFEYFAKSGCEYFANSGYEYFANSGFEYFANSGCECQSCNRMVGWQLSATRGQRRSKNNYFPENDYDYP